MNIETVNLTRAAIKIGICDPVCAIIEGVTTIDNDTLYEEEKKQLLKHLSNLENVTSSKEFQGFYKLFKTMGYEGQTTAGIRIINSILSKGFKSYNNIIDACNIVSATLGYGIGLHDADAISGNIWITRATTNQEIVPLFKQQPTKILEGDLIYRDSKNVIAWLGKRDVDSDLFKITAQSQNLLFVALGNANTSYEYNKTVCLKYFDLLKIHNPNIKLHFLKVIHEDTSLL